MVLGNRGSKPFLHMALATVTKMFKSFQRQYHQTIMQNICLIIMPALCNATFAVIDHLIDTIKLSP
jgi:hypothetical protein